MNHKLSFDFSVNRENKTINIKREFAAGLEFVWDAWTKPELLDQWWAPKPYKAKTKSMDFREGGTWLYSMTGPKNDVHWSKVDYIKIENRKMFSGLDAFCDENGAPNKDLGRSKWTNRFSEEQAHTVVNVGIEFDELSDLENIIKMGFKEGFSMAFENLDQYIETQFKLRGELRTDNRPRVCTYLNFPGNTEEAFCFYQSVFKTAFNGGLQRFGDIPPEAGHPPVAESVKKMIIHVELPITGNHILMGTDAPKELGFDVVIGNNMHISIEPESKEEATRIFNELSAGGKVTMPLQDMFWGAYYGSFQDKYGVNWMINYNTNNN